MQRRPTKSCSTYGHPVGAAAPGLPVDHPPLGVQADGEALAVRVDLSELLTVVRITAPSFMTTSVSYSYVYVLFVAGGGIGGISF